MNIKDFNRILQAKRQQIADAIHRRLPVKVGRIAQDHFQDNFRKGGYVDHGLHTWPVTRRQQQPTMAAAAQYGPLLSARKNLFSSIRYVPGDAQVIVGTSVPYAHVHNQGADITTHPRVTPKMRKYAWAMYFAAGGKNAPQTSKAQLWKALALTRKQQLNVTSHIPRRQFLGPSYELNQKIQQTIEKEISNIIKA